MGGPLQRSAVENVVQDTVKDVEARLAESEKARACLAAELAAAQTRIAELEAALARADEPSSDELPLTSSLDDELPLTEEELLSAQLDLPRLAPVVAPPSPYVACSRVGEVEVLPTMCSRLGGRDDPVASVLDGRAEDLGRISGFEAIYVPPRGHDLLFACDDLDDDDSVDELAAQSVLEWSTSTWEELGVDPSVAATTACGRAFEAAGVPADELGVWAKGAIGIEAAANRPRAHSCVVRFRHYDLSTLDLPNDLVPGSNEDAERVVCRLFELRKLAVPADAALAFEKCLVEVAATHADVEVQGAARLWANELASLAHGDLSPVKAKLSDLVSTVLRFHLRRLFNPPPPPASKPRVGLGILLDDDDDDVRLTRSAARRRRRDSLCRRPNFLDDDDGDNNVAVRTVTVDRSSVYKILKLEVPDGSRADGAVASQLTTALQHLAAAEEAAADTALDDHIQRYERLAVVLAGTCAHAFLTDLLTFPNLDDAVQQAGGWESVEKFARIAVAAADDHVATLYRPLLDVKATTRQLDATRHHAVAIRDQALHDLDKLKTDVATTRGRRNRALIDAINDLLRWVDLYPAVVPA